LSGPSRGLIYIHVPTETAETPSQSGARRLPCGLHCLQWAAVFCVTLTSCPFRHCCGLPDGPLEVVELVVVCLPRCIFWVCSLQGQVGGASAHLGPRALQHLACGRTGQEDNLPRPMVGLFGMLTAASQTLTTEWAGTVYSVRPHTLHLGGPAVSVVWVVLVEGCIAEPVPADHQSLLAAPGGHRHLRHGRARVSGPWLRAVSSFPASRFVLASRKTGGNVSREEGLWNEFAVSSTPSG